METNYEKKFWDSYADNHFWRLNDKKKVKENSVYYDSLYDSLMPTDRAAKILDVGSGGGHFLAYLVRKGYTGMEGVDLAPGLVEFVKNEIWPNVKNVDALDYLSNNLESYDVVTANDFIEHLNKKEIIKFLFLCIEALKPGGVLLIKTPNMSNLFASRNRYVDFTHEVGFTEHSLYEVCAAAGFENVQIVSEEHATKEPKIFKWIRRVYQWCSQSPPDVLSTNLIAVCTKKKTL